METRNNERTKQSIDMETNKPQVLFPFPADEMWEKIRLVVRSELQNMHTDNKAVEPPAAGFTQQPLYKADEVCKLLRISRQTLHQWVKGGIIKAYKVKSRVFFLPADIEKLTAKDAQ